MNTFDALCPLPTGGRNADDIGMPPESPVRCPFCRNIESGWLANDLRRGWRYMGAVLQYHCYDGYCLD